MTVEVRRSDTFEEWRQKTNQISEALGDSADLPSLGTNAIEVLAALAENNVSIKKNIATMILMG